MNYKPEYSKQMERFLKDPNFLKEHGITILAILDSISFWQSLKRRVDFLFYSFALKYDAGISPKETYMLNADALYTLVESDIISLKLNYEELLIDELYRQFISFLKSELQSAEAYNFFSAPYCSVDPYKVIPSHVTIWLEQLTEEMFREPLSVLIRQFQSRVRRIADRKIYINMVLQKD